LISLYYLLKKLHFNTTACQHTRLSSCGKMPDFIARHMWYSICLKMQNMIAKKPRNVLILHYLSISFHTLCDIAFKCSRQ